MLNAGAPRTPLPSHFETASRSSDFADAIPAPFVAQIIAQVLGTDRPDTLSARRAYTRTRPAAPQLIRAA